MEKTQSSIFDGRKKVWFLECSTKWAVSFGESSLWEVGFAGCQHKFTGVDGIVCDREWQLCPKDNSLYFISM